MEDNSTLFEDNSRHEQFERRIAILISITFSITFLVGLIGNSLVLLTVLLQKQMRSTTNILILNLAIAELLFIILCVPFTGLNYVLSIWYFGDVVCRIVQYTSNVTAYVIVLLLVFMSLDRYLAIHSFKANAYRSQKNAIYAVSILWSIVLITNLPQLYLWSNHEYVSFNENRTVCILKYNVIIMSPEAEEVKINNAKMKIQIYYLIFFMFAYVIPFISIVFLYGLIMIKLKKAKGQAVSKGKRKITFMVVVVVSSFVLCWGPLHIMLFLQHVLNMPFKETEVTVLVISNCIGYLNACVNPIIYGFANQDFRMAYAAILKCEYHQRKYAAVATQLAKNELKASKRVNKSIKMLETKQSNRNDQAQERTLKKNEF